jgi:hypothetical protein
MLPPIRRMRSVGSSTYSGGGWSVTGPQPVPSAIAIKIDVPWARRTASTTWELALLTGEGEPVKSETPDD